MPINILLCGLVRTPDLLLQSMRDFVKLRNEGLVDRVFFSTWKGEVGKYESLREGLIASGVSLIESDEPEYAGTSIFHQMKTLESGLDRFGDDDRVLKTRCDVYIRPEFIAKLATDETYLKIDADDTDLVFQEKVWIPWFEITKPFYMGEECFFGRAGDLRKLVNYDVSYDVKYDMDAGRGHIRRFIHPFLGPYPHLVEYLRSGAKTGHNTVHRFDILRRRCESEDFWYYLAFYYLIIRKYFRIEADYVPNQIEFRKWSQPKVTVDANVFDENFSKAKSWNNEKGQIYAYNEEWLCRLLRRDIDAGALVSRFYEALDRCESEYPSLRCETDRQAAQALNDVRAKPGLVSPRTLTTANTPNTNHQGACSMRLDLQKFFQGISDYVILKLPEEFPHYRDYSDLDILCANRQHCLQHIVNVGKVYEARGFRVKVTECGHNLHVDFIAPGASRLSIRFDLIETLAYKKFEVSPRYADAVLKSAHRIDRGGVSVCVPSLEHDLALRFLEYVEHVKERPDKVKHWQHIQRVGKYEFAGLVDWYTDLNVALGMHNGAMICHVNKKGGIPDNPPVGKRYDGFLIWGHGVKYTKEILSMLRAVNDFRIIIIVRKDVGDIRKFVSDIYACDTARPSHLRDKTRYLLTTPSEVVFILVENRNPQEAYFGKGISRKIQSTLVKDVKEDIRNRFNPRKADGKRTEDHVIHASDYEAQVPYMLGVLGLRPLEYYTRQSHPEINATYHIEPFEEYHIREVPVDNLRANILGLGLVPVDQTPHYQYVAGSRHAYESYHGEHWGTMLIEDHFPEAFDRLLAEFREDYVSPEGKKSFIVARAKPDGTYQILDGVHRASILRHRGVAKVAIVEPVYPAQRMLPGPAAAKTAESRARDRPSRPVNRQTALEPNRLPAVAKCDNATHKSTSTSLVPMGRVECKRSGKIVFLTVGCINYDCNINFSEPLEELFDAVVNYNYMERLERLGQERMNAEVVQVVRREKPDYVLFHAYQGQITLDTLDRLAHEGAKVVAWFSDDRWRFDNYSRFVGEHVYCSVTTDKHSVPKYRDLGLKVVLSQWASNHHHYRKVNRDLSKEVTFVGNRYGQRAEKLMWLQERGIPVEVFGKTFGRYVTFDQMVDLFNTSRINLSFTGSSRDDRIKQIKGRTFEVPMCGGFLLTEYADGMEEYFEIGREIECFRCLEEAADKIRFYLRHERLRKEIAERGHQRALRDHTWVKRLDGLFRDLDRMSGKEAAVPVEAVPVKCAPIQSLPSGPRASAPTGKRVLLTTSAAPTQSPFSTSEKRPPLGIGFLISVLREAGHEVSFIDNYLQPNDFLETGYLKEHAIDVVGIYANTICFRDTLRMLHALEDLRRTRQWQGKIVVGGPHTTVAPETIPDFVDHVVQGEGERAILDIVEDKVQDRLVRYPRIENLDELPRPAWDVFVNQPYRWDVSFFPDTPVFTMNTSRGCPFQCTFCSVGSIWGKRYTCFSAERIVADIEYLIQNYNAKGIYFREDNFTLDEKRLRRFCQLLKEKNLQISWACESRVSTLTRELVEMMAGAGLKGFFFGVESGSQRMLDILRKGIKVPQIEQAFVWCHEFGVKAAASMVVGVPEETEADLKATRDLLQRVRPTVTWANVFVGIPDSRLYRQVLKDRQYEYIDDRGLVYLKGHNERVRCYYGDARGAELPDTEEKKDWTVKPKVSVLMGVHNGARYLRQALESLRAQTYQDFELVIVDDSSTDETADILLAMKDSRTVICRNDENQGLTKSLNIGLRFCRGEYVARMDADDISLPSRFEKQVAFLDGHPEVALVGSAYDHIDAAGNVTAHVGVPSEDREIQARLGQKNCFGHGTVMVRRSVLVECGGYDERYARAQDYDLWLRIAEKHQMANLSESLYYWRSTEHCITRTHPQEQVYYKELAIQEAKQRRLRMSTGRTENRSLREDAKPLVSVIIPTYNRPEQLKRAIESVQNQTYSRIEIIVVNNAGAEVESVVQALNAEGDIRLFKHATNKGPGAARNTAIHASRGKYIAYLDDDDIYYPDHVETLVNALETTPFQVAHSHAHRSHEARQGQRYVRTHKTTPYTMDVTHEGLLVCNLVPILCIMHERACLDAVGNFDETLPTHEDWDLWIRMSRHYKFLHVKRVTAEVTWRDDGTTMTSSRLQEFVTVPERVYQKYQSFVADKPQVAALQAQRLRDLRRRARALDAAMSARGGTNTAPTPTNRETVGTALAPSGFAPQSKSAAVTGKKAFRIAIKTCTPSRARFLWGDTWFAQGLAKALSRAGHACRIDLHDAWDQADDDVDVTIHIKGLYEYKLKPHNFNIIWVISHPERHRIEELNQYDAVFCASKPYLDHIQSSLRVPSMYLPQATDTDIFQPLAPAGKKDIDLLFVGNNYNFYRGQRRKVIDDLLATGKDDNLWIVGLHWKGMVDARYVKANYIHPQQLPSLYSRAKIVLNDHHETMRAWGFVNDRTYDLAAIQAFQISDSVPGLDELGIVTYANPQDLRAKVDYFLAHTEERERIARLVHERCKAMTFDRAAASLLEVVHRQKAQSAGPLSVAGAAPEKVNVTVSARRLAPQLGRDETLSSQYAAHLAELERNYRATPRTSRAKRSMAVRLSELYRRVRLSEKSRALRLEAETWKDERREQSALPGPTDPDSTQPVPDRQPKVTVITPCRNGEKWLAECLDSILSQTMREWQLFLIDDGSTDGTRRIIEDYARRDVRIKPYYFDESAGPYVRRNFAITQAETPFVMIHDADDIMATDKVQRLYEAITEDDCLGVIGSFHWNFLDEFIGIEHSEAAVLPTTHEQIMEDFREKEAIHFLWHGSAIIRRELFETLGLYDENPFGADSFWLLKLAIYARDTGQVRLKNIPAYLTLRRLHARSQTGVFPPIDPRSRRARYWQYCQKTVVKAAERTAAKNASDVARALRECTCGDFLERFRAEIVQWESQPPDKCALEEVLRRAIARFQQRKYVSCARTLRDVEVMDPTMPRWLVNFDLLRAMALYGVAMLDQCQVYLRREIEHHNSPMAQRFIKECLSQNGRVDVHQWTTGHADAIVLKTKVAVSFPATGKTDKPLARESGKVPEVVAATCRTRQQPGMKVDVVR